MESYKAGNLNNAELGMANLERAMRDPSYFKDVAENLRDLEGRAHLVKMLANPTFQKQASQVVKQMKSGGALADFLTVSAAAAFNPSGLATMGTSSRRQSAARASQAVSADLTALAEAQQIPMGYWDPLKLGESRIFGQSNEATIGFLRHAEIKHGRVAMAGFVGYCIHENGYRWPFPLSTSLPDYSSFEGLSAPAVWNAVPQAGRLQIFALIGLLEWWSEYSPALEKDGEAHYMRGGKPGYFPKFNEPYPLQLYDPFGLFKGMDEELKEKRLNREVNNGRLAMLGMMSLVSEARVPGAVPALKGLIKQYDGEVMAPLSPTLDTNWQGVDAMFDIAKEFPWNQ